MVVFFFVVTSYFFKLLFVFHVEVWRNLREMGFFTPGHAEEDSPWAKLHDLV